MADKAKRDLRSNSSNSSPVMDVKSAKGATSNSESPVTLVELKNVLAESVAQINQKVETIINERLEKLREDIKSDFDGKIANLESTVAAQAAEIDALRAHNAMLAGEVDSLAMNFHSEIRKSVQNNIVVSGIPEDEDGTEMPLIARNILEKLGSSVDNISHFLRVGKEQNGRPRLLKISLHSACERIKILKNARLLRLDSQYEGIYVNSDLTFGERQERKRLREKSLQIEKENPTAEIILRRGKLVVDGTVVDFISPHRHLFRAKESSS